MRFGEILRRHVHKSAPALLEILFPKTASQRAVAILTAETLSALESRVALHEDADIVSFFSYGDPRVKALIWELKYRGHTRAADLCANALYECMLQELKQKNSEKNFTNPLLVPIPLSKKRLAKRGFNQSELIAKKMSRGDSGRNFTLCTDVLYKIKDTKNQTSIKDKTERQKNLRGCFSIKDTAAIKNRNIILIDDVATTGSTLLEAKKTLLEAGAREVICFTIAH